MGMGRSPRLGTNEADTTGESYRPSLKVKRWRSSILTDGVTHTRRGFHSTRCGFNHVHTERVGSVMATVTSHPALHLHRKNVAPSDAFRTYGLAKQNRNINCVTVEDRLLKSRSLRNYKGIIVSCHCQFPCESVFYSTTCESLPFPYRN